MLVENQNYIWGKSCDCGNDCFILQNKFHPWSETDFIVKMTCPKCGENFEVNQKDAQNYYNKKLFSYYKGIDGTVLDLGCGKGFLTQHINNIEEVNEVYGLDVLDSSVDSLDKVTFIKDDLKNLSKHFKKDSIDYLVHRDVFMFVSDTKQYFDDVTNIVRKGIYQMGWFLKGNSRMENQLEPNDIKIELEKRGWKVYLEYLDWYKLGYFIKASKL
ncbi:methyltransferase domain-containing protein [Mycoplasmatota bacterium]|nr:methyltransferase domain-containing protein [Mycoplasmatota bacterium]